MIRKESHDRMFDLDVASAMARASLDAYLGPEHTERLRNEWEATEAKLIVTGDTEALLLISDECAILSFRGTSSKADALTDIAATKSRWRDTYVHSGFLRAWDSIRSAVVYALRDKLDQGQPLYVTGHSLGGALATLCACDFAGGAYAGRTVLYTFGSPRVGDKRFVDLCNKRLRGNCWRFVHSNDVIPRVPRLFRTSFLLPRWVPLLPTTRRYRHVDGLVFLTEDGHALVRPSWGRVLFERLIGFRFDIGRDHSMVNYLEAVL